MSSATSSMEFAQKGTLPLIRKTVGGLLAGNVAANNATVPHSLLSWCRRPTIHDKKRRRQQQPSPSQQQEPRIATWKQAVARNKWWFLVGPVVGLHVVYPVGLLLLFRISEQISWLQLFQRYHACHAMGMRDRCFQLYGIHVIQIGSFLAVLAMLRKLLRNYNKRSAAAALFAVTVTSIVVFKLCVDNLQLYRPPSSNLSLLEGKVAVVTGANRGIGFATARALADHGAHVVLTCRSMEKCQTAIHQIHSTTTRGSATAALLDLHDLESARALTERLTRDYPAIHFLFCNAGTTPGYNLTTQGFEDGFGGMHLAHMAVVLGLLPSLVNGGLPGEPSRIVMVSSEMAINSALGVFGNDPLVDEQDLRGERTRGDGTIKSLPAYGRAKLCNVLFALELNRRMHKEQWPVVINAVHTGAVVTTSSRNSISHVFDGIPLLPWLVGRVYFPLLWRSAGGGARVLLCAALSHTDPILQGGQYLDALCQPFLPPNNDVPIDVHDTVTFRLPGTNNSWIIYKDAIQALQVADASWSKRLWDVSLSLLQNSPAKDVVKLAP